MAIAAHRTARLRIALPRIELTPSRCIRAALLLLSLLGAAASAWAQTAPTFGPDLAWGNFPCHNWPAPATDQPHAIAAAGAAPILLVGTTRDPATPYPWAVAVSYPICLVAIWMRPCSIPRLPIK